jgi:hypothetical protein
VVQDPADVSSKKGCNCNRKEKLIESPRGRKVIECPVNNKIQIILIFE